LTQQKAAVDSGHWPLYRYDPRRAETGQPPLVMDSGAPTLALETYLHAEARYRMVEQATPDRYQQLLHAEEAEIAARQTLYRDLAAKKI
jgi:pyruvate-ferredoxin/flavodoxin oxidoreductase